jgi:hypothetical protein
MPGPRALSSSLLQMDPAGRVASGATWAGDGGGPGRAAGAWAGSGTAGPTEARQPPRISAHMQGAIRTTRGAWGLVPPADKFRAGGRGPPNPEGQGAAPVSRIDSLTGRRPGSVPADRR